MRSALANLLGLVALLPACSHRPPPAHARPAAGAPAAGTPGAATTAAPRPRPLTPDLVLATIRSDYLPGMQRCYRRYLKRNDRARGRVLISFTVDARGRAREAAASGVADAVDDCIVAQLQRWTFPAPPHGASRFALGLDLISD